LEFTEDKLLKIVREEAIKKVAAEKKREVKDFLKLQEQRSSAQVRSSGQRGYLGGPAVGTFQGILGLEALANSARRDDTFKNGGFKDAYMDGRRGRAFPGDNLDAAFDDFMDEIDTNKLGPYTHRAWELWVARNYTAEQQAKATRVYRSMPEISVGIAEIFDDNDMTVPIAAPGPAAVATNWEIAGAKLGWTIGTSSDLQGSIRSTNYHVENAVSFMQAILANSQFGGFNPRLAALAELKTGQAAERARRRAEDDDGEDTTRDRGTEVSTIGGEDIAVAVPQRTNEPDVDYARRRDASATYIQSGPAQYGLPDLPDPENPALIDLGGLYNYDGAWQSTVPTSIYFLITPGDLPGGRGQRKMHPIITKAALVSLASQAGNGFYWGTWSGIGGNVGARSIESIRQLVLWLGGLGNRTGGGVFDESGSQNLSGRVGFIEGGQVFDALSFFLYQFKNSVAGEIDSDLENSNLIQAMRKSEYIDGEDDEDTGGRIDSLEALIGRLVSRPGGRRQAATDTVEGNPWVVRLARERTEEIEDALGSRDVRESSGEKFTKKDVLSLSHVIGSVVKESFGVEEVSRDSSRARRRRAPEAAPVVSVPEPSAPAGIIFRIGHSGDTASIVKVQRFFGTAQTGAWSGDDDRAFLSYFELYYSGRRKPGLKGVIDTGGGWDGMAQYLAVNQIGGGYNSGPSGLLSFVTTPGFFRSQSRRIRNFLREER
jgi:hypothetical protein